VGGGMYCPKMDCVNDLLHHMHEELLSSGGVDGLQVDRYIPLCSLLQQSRASVGDGLTGGGGEKGARAGCTLHRVRILCACGDGHAHGCTLSRWGSSTNTGSSILVRLQSGRYVRRQVHPPPVELSFRSFVSSGVGALQYGMLPDLGMYVRSMLVREYYSSAMVRQLDKVHASTKSGKDRKMGASENLRMSMCSTFVEDSIPCMKRAKRSSKGIDLKRAVSSVESTTCLNVVMGGLMAIYPRSVRRPTFQCRVNIYGRMMELMHGNTGARVDFLTRYGYIVKICFMEYTFNVISDFMPCEDTLLSAMHPMKLYKNICQSTCDGFRQDAICTGLEDWGVINTVAGVCVDRCIRMCRFKMLKVETMGTKYLGGGNLPCVRSVLSMHSTFGASDLLRHMYPTISDEEFDLALQLHSNISVHLAPEHVRVAQMKLIRERFSSCYQGVYNICHKNVCLVCALSGKGINSPVRMRTDTSELVCTTCSPGTIVQINMVGTVLRVCNTSYYMCVGCGQIKTWDGGGQDMVEQVCNCEGTQEGPMSALRHRRCHLCDSKNTVGVSLHLPHVAHKVVRVISLCSRHTPPQHVMGYVSEYEELMAAVQATTASRVYKRSR
jgi:hypothetical protein